MRPVNKGISPYVTIKAYGDALPHLEEKIGCYCSYCEFPIDHSPEIEHIFAKSRGGDLTNWDNLLLACKYCNNRKGTIIGDNLKDIWLWPDEHNTFLAFTYEDAIPKVNDNLIKSISTATLEKAIRMFNDLKLNNIPVTPRDKDRRWIKRNNTYNKALEYCRDWQKHKHSKFKEQFLKSISDLARSEGFFSIWMRVFEKETEVKRLLINTFVGTDINSFDNGGNPVIRKAGEL
jgi:hypothetical protein